MPYLSVLLIAIFIFCAAIWQAVSLKDITRHRANLERADKQLAMYLVLQSKARDAPERQQTQEQVDISQAIYHNVVLEYNRCIIKPQNMILARIMGYHTIREGKES